MLGANESAFIRPQVCSELHFAGVVYGPELFSLFSNLNER